MNRAKYLAKNKETQIVDVIYHTNRDCPDLEGHEVFKARSQDFAIYKVMGQCKHCLENDMKSGLAFLR